MKKITKISGKTIPLTMSDVDTDLIIPAQYLTAVTKKGYGENVFRRLRDKSPDFVFNQDRFAGANILISQINFGCGSSREHAVWALQEAGIEAVIAMSFADIFYNNSAKNGLLLIQLSASVITQMLQDANSGEYQLMIDVEQQRIQSNRADIFHFEMDAFCRYCFVQGMDDLDYLINHKKQITDFEQRRGDRS
jgi:3-isopropylmalate/(R)-2-methylmalate dehydratase small subunit